MKLNMSSTGSWSGGAALCASLKISLSYGKILNGRWLPQIYIFFNRLGFFYLNAPFYTVCFEPVVLGHTLWIYFSEMIATEEENFNGQINKTR